MDKSIHKELLKYPGVVAVGTGRRYKNGKKIPGSICASVGVVRKLPLQKLAQKDVIPSVLGEFATDVVQIGKIRALQATGRERPARGGVSIGHFEITAGTLSCWVRKGNKPYVLSNNHVLANSNAGKIGDPILQPGPYDGGQIATDTLAKLSEFVPINFDEGTPGEPPGCAIARAFERNCNRVLTAIRSDCRLKVYRLSTGVNLIDAALAEPVNPNWATPEIKDIGTVKGTVMPSLDMPVKKSGRTTELKRGNIIGVDFTVVVDYGGPTATFEDQIVIGPGGFSAGGDSGSLIVNSNNEGVGLLFAGSDEVTIAGRIQNVFSLLGIEGFWV